MKYVMLIPDGAADLPVDDLGGKTPLEAANTPFLDMIAREGIGGTVRTIPSGIGTGSDVASLSLLGYDPRKYYTGRGPLEAAYHGIDLKKGQIAYRCNLITEKDGKLYDYSSGHITSDEAALLIKAIDDALGTDKIQFHPGVSYRHLMILKEGGSEETKCYPPHDVLGKPIEDVMPSGFGSKILIDLIKRSPEVLEKHEVNEKRIAAGKNPANMIWPWGQGGPPHLSTFKDRFGIEGSVITAVDVIKGIGVYSGLDVINVNGATGYYDTNYEEKAAAALASLKMKDFVFVHVEAPDEAGHEGNPEAKVKALEDFDGRTVRLIMESLPEFGDYRVLVVPDHATPCSLRTHDPAPVPFAIYSSNGKTDGMPAFDEKSANGQGSVHLKHGEELIHLLIDS